MVPYLESDKKALERLLSHNNINIRSWVGEYITHVDKAIIYETERDKEDSLKYY